MERKLLYAFRGWIAFVAFMDLGTAFRSYIEKRSFLGDPSDAQFMAGDYTISRIIGMYCILKAFALVHCTLYIHYKPVNPKSNLSNQQNPAQIFEFIPIFLISFHFRLDMHSMDMIIYFGSVVSMGGCSLALTMVLYLTEALYFRSSTLTFYVIFPCVLNSITLIGLIYIPKRLRLWDPHMDNDDENSQLLKQMGGFKKRRAPKKMP